MPSVAATRPITQPSSVGCWHTAIDPSSGVALLLIRTRSPRSSVGAIPLCPTSAMSKSSTLSTSAMTMMPAPTHDRHPSPLRTAPTTLAIRRLRGSCQARARIACKASPGCSLRRSPGGSRRRTRRQRATPSNPGPDASKGVCRNPDIRDRAPKAMDADRLSLPGTVKTGLRNA